MRWQGFSPFPFLSFPPSPAPPRVQKEGAIEARCRAVDKARARIRSGSVSMPCSGPAFCWHLSMRGHGQLRDGRRDDPGGILERATTKRERGTAARAHGRGPKNGRRRLGWRNVVTGTHVRLAAHCSRQSVPVTRRLGPRRPFARIAVAALGPAAACAAASRARTGPPLPLPLPHCIRSWLRKPAEVGPTSFFSPRGCVCPKTHAGFGRRGEGGRSGRGGRAAGKIAIDRPYAPPASYCHRLRRIPRAAPRRAPSTGTAACLQYKKKGGAAAAAASPSCSHRTAR